MVPDHIYSEIVKLYGVKFKSNPLVLEESKTKHKEGSPDKQNSAHHPFTNYYVNITHQHEQQEDHQYHQQQQQQSQLEQHQQRHKEQCNNHQKQHQGV